MLHKCAVSQTGIKVLSRCLHGNETALSKLLKFYAQKADCDMMEVVLVETRYYLNEVTQISLE